MSLHRAFVLCGLLAACERAPEVIDVAPTEDTDTGDEPNVLPIDTSDFIPEDTAPVEPPNIVPSDFIYMRHRGSWELAGSPYTDLTGELTVREYINEIDTSDTAELDPWVCNVTYTLTGTRVDDHTCGKACDFVFEVSHYVNDGNPAACREPDVPTAGAVWQVGYDSANARLLYNYFGTDVWLPWYEASTSPPNLDFGWDFTLAVELEDTAEP